MKRTLILASFCSFLFLASCSKEDSNINPLEKKTTPSSSRTAASVQKTIQGTFSLFSGIPLSGLSSTYSLSQPVYVSRASVTVPAGTTVIFNTATGASKPGFPNPSYPVPGTPLLSTVTRTGNTYTFTTYHISIEFKVSSGSGGISRNIVPTDISNNVFTYTEVTP
jgi:hypothetical protein